MTSNGHKAALQKDLETLREQTISRRKAFAWFAAAGMVPIVGCGTASKIAGDTTTATNGTTNTATDTSSNSDGTTSSTTATSDTCAVIPEETAGPYPGDGSNGANALTLSGIVRSVITSSIGTATGVAAGVPLKIEITLLNASGGCAVIEGYAVYLWHCDRDGNYSMYSSAIASQNYLRGVQAADSAGKVSFTSIYPGCYDGRWPHIHFEIYPSIAKAVSSKNKVNTSQIAMPEAQSALAYAATGYSKSIPNLKKVKLTTDNVFSDGYTLQVPTIEGNATDGFTIKLSVAIDA